MRLDLERGVVFRLDFFLVYSCVPPVSILNGGSTSVVDWGGGVFLLVFFIIFFLGDRDRFARLRFFRSLLGLLDMDSNVVIWGELEFSVLGSVDVVSC